MDDNEPFDKHYDDYMFEYMHMQEAFAQQCQARMLPTHPPRIPTPPVGDAPHQEHVEYVERVAIAGKHSAAADACSKLAMAGRAIERRLKICIVVIRGNFPYPVGHKLNGLYKKLCDEENRHGHTGLLSSRFVHAYREATNAGGFELYSPGKPWHYGSDEMTSDEWWAQCRSLGRGQKIASVGALFQSMDDDCQWWDIEYRGETLQNSFPMAIGGPWLAFLEKIENIIPFAIGFRRRKEFERVKGLVSG